MKDFRDKITSYKAKPSDTAFEKMLLTKQKAKLSKLKYGLFALIGLNVLGFLWLTFNLSSPALTEADEISVVESTQEESAIEDFSDLYTSEEIDALNIENEILGTTIETLRKRISELTSTVTSQSGELSKFKNDLQLARAINTRIQDAMAIRSKSIKNVIHEPIKKESIVIEKGSTNVTSQIAGITPLTNRNVSIEQYLLSLASSSQLPKLIKLSSEGSSNKNLYTKWYVTLGSRYENLVIDRQRNMHIGLNRELTKRFDVGVLFDFGQTRQRNTFLLNNDIKDFRLDAYGIALLRFKFINRNKLRVYVDGGIGYRYGVISFRQSNVIDNQLVYFNESQQFDTFLAQVALGALYDITPKLRLGTRFYLDGNLHSSLDLNYRF